METRYLIQNKGQNRDIDLSEQQIIDCSGQYGNKGCNGGWMTLVYDHIARYGVTDENEYPYAERQGQCKKSGGNFKVSNYKGGSLPSCAALSSMVLESSVTVAVTAGNSYWQSYSRGIMNQCGNAQDVDHGVTLVGVHQDDNENYWKIKNSWGTTWGEKGFIRLNRDIKQGNICNICSYGFYPIL